MSDPAAVRWYPSKVDWWMYPLLSTPFVITGAVLVTALFTGEGLLAALIPAVVVVAVFGGLVVPMRYGITDDEIVIKHGLMTQRAKLSEIVEVYPTRNPISSPALSLDRLFVSTGKGFFKSIMISPESREEFMAELEKKAGLRRVGEKWVR